MASLCVVLGAGFMQDPYAVSLLGLSFWMSGAASLWVLNGFLLKFINIYEIHGIFVEVRWPFLLLLPQIMMEPISLLEFFLP